MEGSKVGRSPLSSCKIMLEWRGPEPSMSQQLVIHEITSSSPKSRDNTVAGGDPIVHTQRWLLCQIWLEEKN